ncbi:MAG TPA: response regulator transcription factor [Lysobacter sp.]|nr:response regulator transcription factor [Lysobacter sp.]
MKVLIVDDSPVIRVRLAELLAEVEGIEVVAQAADAFEAVDLVKALEPDVAIVDVRMPRRSGMELIDDVKRTPQPPMIIMLTNFPTPENRAHCLSRGADYFFDKSSDIDEVLAVLRDLLQKPRGRSH